MDWASIPPKCLSLPHLCPGQAPGPVLPRGLALHADISSRLACANCLASAVSFGTSFSQVIAPAHRGSEKLCCISHGISKSDPEVHELGKILRDQSLVGKGPEDPRLLKASLVHG